MTQAVVSNPSLIKRVTHVAIVALCTASSLLLIGAVPAEWADRTAPAAPAAKAAAVVTTASAQPESEILDSLLSQVTSAVDTFKTLAAAAPRTRVVRMEVTAYCPCTKCCGPRAQGITASGKHVSHNDGKFVAADTRVLGFGTQLEVPGYANGLKVEVIDRGGAIKGNKLDLYFPTHEEALEWGRKWVEVTIVE